MFVNYRILSGALKTFTLSGREYATRVAPALLAIAIPRVEGEVRDMIIGIPIRAHFSTISEVNLPVV